MCRRTRRVWFVVVMLLGACASGPRLPDDMAAAQRLERGSPSGWQTDEQALIAWRAIAEQRCAERTAEGGGQTTTANQEAKAQGEARALARRKDDCGVAWTRQAELLERLGRPEEALATWEQVAARAGDARHAARGLARAAGLAAQMGRNEQALALAWRCVDEYPAEVGADDALELALRLEAQRTPGRPLLALRDRLDALALRDAHLDLGDNLLLAAAGLSAKLGDLDGAVRRDDALAARYPRSSLRDDALWQAAALLRAAHRPNEALDRLRAILATRRTAWIVGSYNSIYLDDAQLLVGRILLDELHDPRRAGAAFLKLADEYRDSLLRDDALLELARARLAMDDHDGACAALGRLLRQYPDGNQARKATEQAHALGCPHAAEKP